MVEGSEVVEGAELDDKGKALDNTWEEEVELDDIWVVEGAGDAERK